MKKKQRKVEEPPASYSTKKPAQTNQTGQVRYVDRDTARRLTKDILDNHSELFRKLAQ